MNLIHNISLDSQPSYSKMLVHYKYLLQINNTANSPRVVFNTKLIFNSSPESPDFENIYIGGENFVRGYYPNPNENPLEISEKFIFKNLIFQSVQFEIPFIFYKSIKTRLLFFADHAMGANKYNDFNKRNKLKGHGFGISIELINQMKFDICIGLNHFGLRTIHFIKSIN